MHRHLTFYPPKTYFGREEMSVHAPTFDSFCLKKILGRGVVDRKPGKRSTLRLSILPPDERLRACASSRERGVAKRERTRFDSSRR
jgi:hypothetical protein